MKLKIGDIIESLPTGNIGIVTGINNGLVFYKVKKIGLMRGRFWNNKIGSIRHCDINSAKLIKRKSSNHPLTNIFQV